MQSSDYPSLYNECGTWANKNQKKHYCLISTRIALLIAIAVIGAIAWKNFPQFSIYPPLAIAAFLGILLVFTAVMENNNYESDWFVTRAIAEMIKRETWLFMMRVKPYDLRGDKDDNEVVRKFERFLDQVNDRDNLKGKLSINRNNRKVTEAMKAIRNLKSPEQRKQKYVNERVVDQMHWYDSKAKISSKKQAQFNGLMWSLLGLAVIIAMLNIVYGNLAINGVGIATTTSASALSWMGAKKYKELSRSYGIAAINLSSINTTAAAEISAESELISIVRHAEKIMSLEHSLWTIKRLPDTTQAFR